MSQYPVPPAGEPAKIRFVRVVTSAEIPSDRGRPVFVRCRTADAGWWEWRVVAVVDGLGVPSR